MTRFRIADCGLRTGRKGFSNPELPIALFLIVLSCFLFANGFLAAARKGAGIVAAIMTGLLASVISMALLVGGTVLFCWIANLVSQWMKCPRMNTPVRIRYGDHRHKTGRIIARKLGWDINVQVMLDDEQKVVSLSADGVEKCSKDGCNDSANPQSPIRNPQSE